MLIKPFALVILAAMAGLLIAFSADASPSFTVKKYTQERCGRLYLLWR